MSNVVSFAEYRSRRLGVHTLHVQAEAGFVVLCVDDTEIQLTPTTARALAVDLYEVDQRAKEGSEQR